MVRRTRRISVAGFLILSFFPIYMIGASKRTGIHDEAPSWRLDLRPMGFVEKSERRTRYVSDTRISFIREDLLLGSFWTESTPGGCTWKEKAGPDRCRLHAVEIEVGTGRITSTHEWSFPFREGFIYPNGRGSFILSWDNELDLYSSNFEESKKVLLPSAEPGLPMLFIHVSPSGRTLLADWIARKTLPQTVGAKTARKSAQREIPQESHTIFATDDMKELRQWDENLFTKSVSDNLLVATTGFDFTSLSRPGFLISRFNEHGWHDLYMTRNWLSTEVKLLDDQRVVVQERNRVAVLNTEGASLFEDTTFRKQQYLSGDPVTSADGLRLAVAVWVDAPHPFWVSPVSVQAELLVYDVPQRSRIYTLPLDMTTQVGNLWALHDFALSPDGSLLAHTADGLVELYHLPRGKSACHTA